MPSHFTIKPVCDTFIRRVFLLPEYRNPLITGPDCVLLQYRTGDDGAYMGAKTGNEKKKSKKALGMLFAILLVLAIGCSAIYLLRIQVKRNCEKAMTTAADENRQSILMALNQKTVYLDMVAERISGNGDASGLIDMTIEKKKANALEMGIYFDQDGCFYLSDGTTGKFIDNTMRDSVETASYSIMSVNVPELGGITCLAIVLPIHDGNRVCGMVFGYFDMEEFMELFSQPVYEESGFSFLSDINGNVVVASFSFAEIDEKGQVVIEGGTNTKDLSTLTTNICSNGIRKLEAEVQGANNFICGVPLEGYDNLAVITIVNADVVYRNVFRVSAGVAAATCLLLVALTIQFITMFSSERSKKKEIAEAVNYDELTGLSSKPHHKDECTAILKKAKGNYAYAVMDISDFSAINAACGYEYGNAVLKNVARVMNDSMQKNECCSRTSADHFAMLLKYENQERLLQRLYLICEKAGKLPEDEEGKSKAAKKENIIFNCGVYLIQSSTEDINRIRARANTARKSLKKGINTQISFYNDDEFRKKMENHELEMDLLNSVVNNEMVVFLQPKYGAVSEKMNGAEALVRWKHPVRGMISPNDFIPIAEEDGYVKVIDFFVFETVCEQLCEWKKKGYRDIVVSVNFSRRHLSDEDFVQSLCETADAHGVEHKNLEIELTETADFNDMEKLLNVMYRIKEAGFGLAMDDFGSGYSSLQLLMKMPTGVLKMDKSLIDDCTRENEVDNRMAANIISLAQGRGHSVVAEGVETEEQKDILRDANCDMIQGYYYSKPVTIQAFEALMEADMIEAEAIL